MYHFIRPPVIHAWTFDCATVEQNGLQGRMLSMFIVYVLRQIQVHAKCQIIFTCSDPAPALPSFEISEH